MSSQSLKVGIDACNIRRGGGLTHLIQLLQAADPEAAGIGQVVVWSRAEVLARLPDRPWLSKRNDPALEGSLPRRMLWQRTSLPAALKRERCDVLFAPAGLLPGRAGVPTVTMSRNMLPFEPVEAGRGGRWSLFRLKMWLLRIGQVQSMRRANGLIFLTEYARTIVMRALGPGARTVRTIPHGLADRFFFPPRVVEEGRGGTRPYRLLYVSTVDIYKHQWNVVHAAAALRDAGLPVQLDLIGSPVSQALARLQSAIAEVDPNGTFIRYHNSVPFEELHRHYQRADNFVFASSCENLPNILLEAMAAGLPIACSNMGPMPEVLGTAGVYFDPLDSASIACAIDRLARDPGLRGRLAEEAHVRARAYSWSRCAADTLAFIAQIARAA